MFDSCRLFLSCKSTNCWIFLPLSLGTNITKVLLLLEMVGPSEAMPSQLVEMTAIYKSHSATPPDRGRLRQPDPGNFEALPPRTTYPTQTRLPRNMLSYDLTAFQNQPIADNQDNYVLFGVFLLTTFGHSAVSRSRTVPGLQPRLLATQSYYLENQILYITGDVDNL